MSYLDGLLKDPGRLQAHFDLLMEVDWAIELDSTTKTKFSRHLIVAVPGCGFLSNAHAGVFVERMCKEIWEQGSVYSSLLVARVSLSSNTKDVQEDVSK